MLSAYGIFDAIRIVSNVVGVPSKEDVFEGSWGGACQPVGAESLKSRIGTCICCETKKGVPSRKPSFETNERVVVALFRILTHCFPNYKHSWI